MLSPVALLSYACALVVFGRVCAKSDGGNFLDDKWLAGRWDRFRDEPRTWTPSKPMDQGLDPTKDPCLKIKCGRHKVCVAEDYKTATCISQRRVSVKDPGLFQSPGSSDCDRCPVVHPSPVCGTDGHTYSTKCKLDYQACMSGKKISVKCAGMCPCTTLPEHSTAEKKVCSESDLKDVVSRLGEWFRVLLENGSHKRTKLQQPDKSKFDMGPSPICRDPLGWMFSRLDTNFDLQLDQSETRSLYLDRDEPCSEVFFRSCDTQRNRLISSSEWCTCFQRHTDSPCKVELSNINKKQAGKKLLGQYLPACDEDGYYRTHQCHGSSGQCWCVDRYGNEASGSRTHGLADCEGVVLESSGDPGSGDPLFSDEDEDSFGRDTKAGMDDEDEDDEGDEDDGTDEYLS